LTLSLTIGTMIIYKGRAYRFCGITPVSIEPTNALLKDLRTGAWSEVPAAQLRAPTPSSPEGTATRWRHPLLAVALPAKGDAGDSQRD
jgi:hypothetical protein